MGCAALHLLRHVGDHVLPTVKVMTKPHLLLFVDFVLEGNSSMKVIGKESVKRTASILFSLPPCSTRSFTYIVHAPASGSLDPQRGIVEEVVNFT